MAINNVVYTHISTWLLKLRTVGERRVEVVSINFSQRSSKLPIFESPNYLMDSEVYSLSIRKKMFLPNWRKFIIHPKFMAKNSMFSFITTDKVTLFFNDLRKCFLINFWIKLLFTSPFGSIAINLEEWKFILIPFFSNKFESVFIDPIEYKTCIITCNKFVGYIRGYTIIGNLLDM